MFDEYELDVLERILNEEIRNPSEYCFDDKGRSWEEVCSSIIEKVRKM